MIDWCEHCGEALHPGFGCLPVGESPEEYGEIPCIDRAGHEWVVSDENENICYCCRCGCMEY